MLNMGAEVKCVTDVIKTANIQSTLFPISSQTGYNID